MKFKLLARLLAMTAAVIFTLGGLPNTTFAQGTAFTYQGRLINGGSGANGTFDLRYAIYDALTLGTQQGPMLTNQATAVSNGLFTVTLDFGDQFPGANRWLEIGVRTNGGSTFTTLTPRQPLTPMPYAVFAGNAAAIAGTIPAGQITGTLPPSALPAGVVTNGATGVNFSGTFSGNGAGLVNVPGAIPLQVVAGTSVQAQPNTAYDANSAAQVTVNLVTNANVGDVVRVSGLGTGGWQFLPGPGQVISGVTPVQLWTPRDTYGFWRSLASSADGNRLFAVQAPGDIYISSDAGAHWTALTDYRNWVSIACSADGSKLVAVVIGGQIYTSVDGGTNWVARDSNRSWIWAASSADGNKLVAVELGGLIYTSTDSGTNWVARGSTNHWWSVASSADGSKLVAAGDSVQTGSQIYTSTDSGTHWVAHDPNRWWRSVTSSADGTKLAAVADYIYTSTDGGTNWIARESARGWSAIASSADGSKLIATVQNGQIYISSDSGTNWVASETNRNWYVVASSADGSKLVAGVNGADLFTTTSTLMTPLVGAQGSSIELQYAGNGVWLPMNLATNPVSLVSLTANQTFSGQNNFSNSANNFTGNGGGLTALKADNLTGFVPPATLASVPAGSLTGAIADARLSANVALRAGGNTFTGNQTITGGSVGIGITPQSTLDVNGTARIDGVNNWNVTGSEGDFRVGNDNYRFKIGVATGGGGAGDVWMRAHGGTSRMFIKTPGGTTFFSNEGETAGVSLAPNGTAWAVVSDRNVKKDFARVDTVQILEKLAAMPITQWHYKWETSEVTPHIGPMAQDFKAAFYPGTDEKSITTQEADGVALAAIQGLNQKLEETRAENADLKKQLAELQQLVQTLVPKR